MSQLHNLQAILRETVRKNYLSGTHRVCTPQETLERVVKHMKIMGITRVSNITGLDRIGIPVAISTRPNSRSLSVSQGKGLDVPAAKASAIMESVESYHAERIDQPLLLGSYEDLEKSRRLIQCEGLPRSRLNLYSETMQILWIEGYDLLSDDFVWVPYELVHTNYVIPRPSGSGCFYASSNGLASGNHILEAVNHALCELIERDSSTLWFLSNESDRNATRLNPDTVIDFECRQILDKYKRSFVEVQL